MQKELLKVEDRERRMIEGRQRQTKIENQTLKTIYPKLYADYIEARVKHDEELQSNGLDLGRTGSAQFEHLNEHLEPQKALKCNV